MADFNGFMPPYQEHKNAPPPESHVFQTTRTIYELVQDIIGINLLTKFHEDRTINVASRKMPCPHKLIQYNIWTNLLTNFHEDQKIVSSRVLTRQMLALHDGQTKLQKLTMSTLSEC
ncbi:hypothetical protein DPMN_110799 [Dreissena polymorpha]|uniref:Uncharacterized protein n=1 Tax=Dreissena polymorpha TaxID=45954 RepID=A0A9D4KCN6_DREPO|nr:hypothetical protein DPMN_110799 [Dreissena polymorpha]